MHDRATIRGKETVLSSGANAVLCISFTSYLLETVDASPFVQIDASPYSQMGGADRASCDAIIIDIRQTRRRVSYRERFTSCFTIIDFSLPITFIQSNYLIDYCPGSSRKMSTNGEIPEIILRTRSAASGVTGESVEPRQILQDEERAPDPSKSIPLPPNRQRLVDDIMALYACEPTIERVSRYAPGVCSRTRVVYPADDCDPACVYDDQFVYANGE